MIVLGILKLDVEIARQEIDPYQGVTSFSRKIAGQFKVLSRWQASASHMDEVCFYIVALKETELLIEKDFEDIVAFVESSGFGRVVHSQIITDDIESVCSQD